MPKPRTTATGLRRSRLDRKVTDPIVREVRRRWALLDDIQDIADDIGITVTTVSRIGRRLAHCEVV